MIPERKFSNKQSSVDYKPLQHAKRLRKSFINSCKLSTKETKPYFSRRRVLFILFLSDHELLCSVLTINKYTWTPRGRESQRVDIVPSMVQSSQDISEKTINLCKIPWVGGGGAFLSVAFLRGTEKFTQKPGAVIN